MKIILISPPSDFNDQLLGSLQKMPISFKWINDRESLVIPIPGKFVWKIIRRIQFLRKFNNKLFHRKVLKMAKTYKPDIIIFNKVMIAKKPLLAELSSMGIKLVNWFPENSGNEPYKSWLESYAPFFDYFFSFDSRIELLNNPSIKTKFFYLPFGVDLDLFSKIKVTEEERKKYSCDISFVGAYYPEREAILKELTDFNLRIYGWKGWENSSLKKYYFGPLNLADSIKVYQSSKISLNINILPVINGVNFKTFEIPASGGFQITDYRSDIDKLLVDGGEVVIFKNIKDLRDKISYYLSNDKSLEIIKNARIRIREEHTIEKRLNQMLKIISI